ncbi:MAG: nitroreductase family protein, partial [Bacteroidales bacterium]|nr:nitroreductase family protein [Bacteroidales bacterium]
HNEKNYIFPEFFDKTLIAFLDKFPTIGASQQLEFRKDEYFRHAQSDFKTFAKSRHSLREFVGIIDHNSIIKAIDLANTSPSACNRQSQKVYIIKETKLKESLLNIHVGSTGFGHMADSFLVITYGLSFWKDYTDRNAGLFDTGMFAMNLLYALHYYNIGACILNSYFTLEQEAAFRAELNIKENENISCIIAIGGVPDKFKIALSERITAETIINER